MDGIDTKPQQGQTQSHAQQNGQPNLKDSKKSKGKKKPNNNSKKPTIAVSNHTNIKDENGLIETVQQMTILDGLNYDQPMANGKHANGSDTDDITNHVDAVSQPQQQHSIENGDALPNEDAITTQCDDLSNGTTVSDTLTTIEGYPVLPSTSEYIDDDQSSLTVNTEIPIESAAPLERIVDAAALAALEPPSDSDVQIVYKQYESEVQMPDIIRLIQKDLSEPYSIYTYRYFIHNWPSFCFLAMHDNVYVGAIVCKLDTHRYVKRGYIAMLAVDKEYRKLKIGTNLVHKAIQAMLDNNAEEVVLETEITNTPALRLYENLGFIRDKRLFHYYLNGVDALRLKLWFR